LLQIYLGRGNGMAVPLLFFGALGVRVIPWYGMLRSGVDLDCHGVDFSDRKRAFFLAQARE